MLMQGAPHLIDPYRCSFAFAMIHGPLVSFGGPAIVVPRMCAPDAPTSEPRDFMFWLGADGEA